MNNIPTTKTIDYDPHYNYIYPEFQKGFEKIVSRGIEYASKQNIAIVSIARNVEKYLETSLSTFKELETKFKSVKYFIYENDSIDNTVEKLKSWSENNHNATIVSEKLDTPHMPLSTSDIRTSNLANARNKCVEYIKTIRSDIDYVLVIDIDFQNLYINGLLSSFGWLSMVKDIDALAGFSFVLKDGRENTYLINYDCWAYRHNWWTDTYSTGSGLMNWFNHWIPLVGSPIFQVNSAFGGSCIYKTESYILGEYKGYDCEHVTFHKNLFTKNQNFKLFVNPSQILYL